ncbi:MAG: response regulator [Pseudomonadota bacterium]
MALRDQLRVMVVDDMSVSRGLLLQALDQMGVANTDWRSDAESALQAMMKSPSHLVISDYNMPGMDGLTFLRTLRGTKQTSKVGFILVTGSEDATLLAKGQQFGLNNYLKKPFTPDSLRKCIEAVVGRL